MLTSGGWNPDRKVDIESICGLLESVGFASIPASKAFLSEFYLLKFDHNPSLEINGVESFCWTSFDPAEVATGRDARIAERCSELIGEDLYPVGTDGFHLTIYITDGMKFFAGRDSYVLSYADSVAGLFGAMQGGRRPEIIGEWQL
ncbi:hypothetical protein Acsp01_91280 [Actinoplanes sp. NBRC 101535]|nr:hypothetical protein Acsp01_91280 [Actinoplanes sp. NBRC 101535]